MCRNFIANFGKFNEVVRGHNGGEERPIVYIFVGGLAASATIRAKMEAYFSEMAGEESRFLSTASPQVVIVKGIPISRTNIS